MSWTPPDGTTVGYRIYFGTASRQYRQPIGSGEYTNATAFTVKDLVPGVTYYFAVTATDGVTESEYSNEAFKTIPP